nr:histidine phosphatase family protein [Butyrivibrio sp. AE2032]
MKIYFARHGQTDWNIQRKVQGTTDIPLNENGIRQAQELCKNLEEFV